MMDIETSNTSFKILMFPWLAHGHIFPYLELAKRILKRKNFHIYMCTTSINFSSIKTFIHNNSLQDSIELVQLHVPTSLELPPHYHTTKNLPSNLVMTLLSAFQKSKTSFSEIIVSLKPDLVIYDTFQPWAVDIASCKGIPSVSFAPFGAAKVSYVHHHYGISTTTPCDEEVMFPFPELSLVGHEKKSIDDVVEFLSLNVLSDNEKDCFMVSFKLSSDIYLLKTCRGLEGKYIDYYSSLCNKKLLTVGPLVPDHDNTNKIKDDEDSEILQWLSKKKPYSTVYTSFGSDHFLSNDEIEEVAKGLELCPEVNFIWIIRFPIEEKMISVEEVLPKGFLERVKGRGIVISGWAPQAKILSHESTGGFVSHCGWSSLTESVYFGVPVIGMPMKDAMFVHARMLGNAGVCVEVLRDESHVFKGEEIAKAISKVILEESGVGLRVRARELSETMKTEEEKSLDETAEELWQICLKNKVMK